jgi:SAM-dependent methyltransferase
MSSAGSARSTITAREQRAEELYLRAPTRQLFARASKDPSSSVLDIGFGRGHSTVWLELATDAECVDCVDRSVAGAHAVRAALRGHFPDVKVRILCGSVEELPYRSETFDVVFCRAVVHAVKLEEAVVEMRRLLKPGGKLFIVTELDENPIVMRRSRPQRDSDRHQGIATGGRLTFATVCGWYDEGVCAAHAEYHLLTPLLFPLLVRLRSRGLGRMLLSITRAAESLLLLWLPKLRRYCRFCFIEIVTSPLPLSTMERGGRRPG